MEGLDYRKKPRKLPMKKRENKASRMCTFTKRRCGLFKKATELELLTGAQIAVVVISEAGRPYFHGSTAVIDRFLAQEASAAGGVEIQPGRSNPNPAYSQDDAVEDLDEEGQRLLREIEDDPCMRWLLEPRSNPNPDLWQIEEDRFLQEDRFVRSLLSADSIE